MAPERSCLPSLCAPPAALFAVQGVPQPEGPTRQRREGGWAWSGWDGVGWDAAAGPIPLQLWLLIQAGQQVEMQQS